MVGNPLGLLDNGQGGMLVALALLAIVAARTGRDQNDTTGSGGSAWTFLVERRRWWAVEEVLFSASFAVACWLRSRAPAIAHTEQPMDFALLSATMQSPPGPTLDPWLAGQSLGYYSLGHRLAGSLAQIAGVPPEVAYNLALATWFGLLVVTSFGLATLLLRAGPRPTRFAVGGGLLSAAAVALAGNPRAVADSFSYLLRPGEAATHWWWFGSSRVLTDHGLHGESIELISETPAFAQVLGDLHAHLLAQPYLLVVVAASLNLLFALRSGAETESKPAHGLAEPLALTFVVAGSLLAMNAWDCLPAWGLVAGAWWLGRPAGFRRIVETVAVVGGLALTTHLIMLPYVAAAQSQAGGPRPNLLAPSALGELLATQGVWILGVGLALALTWRSGLVSRLLASAGGLTLAASFVLWAGSFWAATSTTGQAWWGPTTDPSPRAMAWERWSGNPWSLLILTILAAAILTRLSSIESTDQSASIALLLLAAVGIAVLTLPELVYLDDLFGNRMNTVFKLHSQAWVLLSIVGACASLTAWSRGWRAAGTTVALTIVLSGVFTVAAWIDRIQNYQDPVGTLDGLAHIAKDERDLIGWVRRHVPAGSRIAQGSGHSYVPAEGRLSAATGRPALLGWAGHELQWRGVHYPGLSLGREEALLTLYSSPSHAAIRRALTTWDISYVLFGPIERARYGTRLSPFPNPAAQSLLTLEATSGDYRLYRSRVGRLGSGS
ncbi:MAG: DUF2298 domain-containing protein [Thermoanaerobaculia bacterium]|nr:DUF2298 domain-containing protein [Thermoanaerobaculia bacterium]